MYESKMLGIAIERNWRDVYEAIWRPERFPEGASGLSQSTLVKEGDSWKAAGPEGTVWITFTGHNAFGVMDHKVRLEDGTEVYVPARVIRNGDGAEVQFTLFRLPGMDDEKFAADADWVARDLQALKALVTK